jgi:REP element-mobilizing transposase RayT
MTDTIITSHRRSIRLPNYDYRQDGFYFVTLVCQQRECLFDDPKVRQVAETLWQELPDRFPYVSLDEWVLMPNHLHGVLHFHHQEQVDVAAQLPRERPSGARSGSLGAVVGAYKSLSTRRINPILGREDRGIWQRNYYEHVVRSDRELAAIRQYIRDNPENWALDEHYSHR